MVKAQRTPVRVTEEQLKRYKELASTPGINMAQAIRVVEQEFQLPGPHTRQAIYPHLTDEGIKFSRGTRRAKVAVDIKRRGDGHTNLDQMAQALQEAEVAIEKAKAEILGQLVGKIDIVAMRSAIEKAKLLPSVEADMIKYKRGYENALGTLREDQKTRLARQQGNLPKLTEHIVLRPIEAIATYSPLLTISEGLLCFN